MLRTLTLFLTVALLLAPAARADAPSAKPLPRAELDQRIVRLLYETIDLGADTYNSGDAAGCYRLYQGALIAVAPLLDHRPQLQGMVQKKLRDAQALRTASDRAFALRGAIDEVRASISKDLRASAPTPAPMPLWDRLGGEKAVRVVVHDFVLAAASDPKVNFDRDGRFKFDAQAVAQLEQRLVELVSAVSGGPLKYTGRDMKSSHAGMKITNAEFDALAGHLIAVLKKYQVPPKEIDELVGIVASTRKDIVEKE